MKDRWIREFGPFALDPADGVLRRDGSVVPLAPQPTRLLEMLIGRAGELVTREEIRSHLWPDRVVDFERGIHFCVGQVRAALGESAADAQYVVTVPGRGYRFAAGVAMPRRRRRRWWPAAAAALVVAVAWSAWVARPAAPRHRIEVVAGHGESAATFDRALRAALESHPAVAVVRSGGDWIVSPTLGAGSAAEMLRLDATVVDATGGITTSLEVEVMSRDVERLAEDAAYEIVRGLEGRGRGKAEVEVVQVD